MNAAALSHDALQPRAADQVGLGAALALLAHGGLVAALALALNWRLPATPPVVTAELWSAVPKVAAPAPVEPAPAPPPPAPAPPPPPPVERPAPPPPPPPAVVQRDADIALEKAKREQQEAAERERQAKLEQKRLADERAKAEKDAKAKAAKEAEEAKEKAAAEKLRQQKLAEQRAEEQKAKEAKDAKAKEQKRQAEQAAREKAEAEARDARHDEERIARQREANLKRILGEAGATGSPTAAAGTAARDAGPSGPSAAYAGRIKARVKPNIKLPGDVSGNPVAEVEVRCAADGTIIGRRITKPSGNTAWDEAVLRAIDLTAKLPLDDGKPPPGVMTLVFPRQE